MIDWGQRLCRYPGKNLKSKLRALTSNYVSVASAAREISVSRVSLSKILAEEGIRKRSRAYGSTTIQEEDRDRGIPHVHAEYLSENPGYREFMSEPIHIHTGHAELWQEVISRAIEEGSVQSREFLTSQIVEAVLYLTGVDLDTFKQKMKTRYARSKARSRRWTGR